MSTDNGQKQYAGVMIALAICGVIGIGVPFAMGGIGEGFRNLTSNISLGAASLESQRNALIAIGVGCGFMIAALFGGIALGINFLVAAVSPAPAVQHAAPAAAH